MTEYEYYLEQKKERDRAQLTLEIVVNRLNEHIMDQDSKIALYESFDDDRVEEFYKEIATSANAYVTAYHTLLDILKEREAEESDKDRAKDYWSKYDI